MSGNPRYSPISPVDTFSRRESFELERVVCVQVNYLIRYSAQLEE